MPTTRTITRRFVLTGSGVLVLVAVFLFVDGLTYLPSLANGPPLHDGQRLRTPASVSTPYAPPPEKPGPPSPFSGYEQAILRYLYQGAPTRPASGRFGEWTQLTQEFEKAGGHTPAAFPFYLRLLTWEPRIDRMPERAVIRLVTQTPGDRSTFRKPAVARLNDPDLSLAKLAMQLLVQIAEPEDVPAVVERFVSIEYDDRVEPRDHAYFAEGLKILMKFGGEAEIAALDKAKAEYLLQKDDKFWAKAEACKKAIRERLAKEKDRVDKK
jgi:hypothetical protein